MGSHMVDLLGTRDGELPTVEQQLTLLREVNERESAQNTHWTRITEKDFKRLAETAPAWPKGKHVYRSLRIRFGEGSEGVAQTFEAHMECIKRTFGKKSLWRWGHLHSSPVSYKGKPLERLRLLNGNDTHKAVIEWVIVDLDTHRKRDSITAVRGPNSLADELLAFAWMLEGVIRAIGYSQHPGLFAGGYEVNVPEIDGELWQGVVLVCFRREDRKVGVYALDCGDDDSEHSVPVIQELPALAT